MKDSSTLLCENYSSSIREVSYSDDTNHSLVDSDVEVLNFDRIKKTICKLFRRNCQTSSCDALLEKDNKVYLFEFKDQPERNIDNEQVVKKAFDSLSLLLLSKKNSFSQLDLSKQLVLFVVYKEDANDDSFSKIRKKIGEYARVDEPILFDLSKLKDYFFNEVHTIDANQFRLKYLNEL